MARPLRIEFAGAEYHITACGAGWCGVTGGVATQDLTPRGLVSGRAANGHNFDGTRNMLDFKANRRKLEGSLKAYMDPIFSQHEFVWSKGNFWLRDIGWGSQQCSIGIRRDSSDLYMEIIGGAGLFLLEHHLILQPDYMKLRNAKHVPPTTIGGPIEWIDTRLAYGSGRFTTWEEFERWLPVFRRAFEECAIAELERYPTEDALLAALRNPDWSDAVKLSMSQDRRGALVALMLAKRGGLEKALPWARAEIERIRAQEPEQERPVRWMELQRAVDHMKQSLTNGRN